MVKLNRVGGGFILNEMSMKSLEQVPSHMLTWSGMFRYRWGMKSSQDGDTGSFLHAALIGASEKIGVGPLSILFKSTLLGSLK